ncbi:hypothetical protein ABT202_35185 [Streptomyces sp900105245]|uniref:hypothetical protein n=1 Tax=Streptomyces sp. 900105245 TaxID=3154379 RepID=UPI00332ED417
MAPSAPGRLASWLRAAVPDLPSAKTVALDSLVALGSQFALLLLLVIVGACFLPSGHHGGFGDWLATAALLAGLALRGTASVSASGASDDSGSFGSGGFGDGSGFGDGGGFSGAGALDLTVQPILLTCTALLAVWWFARRHEALSPASTTARIVGRSATAALVYATVLSVLVAVAHAHSGYGLEMDDDLPVSFDIGVKVWPMLFYAFALVFLADCAARSRSRLRPTVRRASARWSDWTGAAVTAACATAGLLAVSFVASLVYIVVGNTGDLGFGTSLAVALFGAPNVAILLGGGLMGATLSSSVDGTTSAQVGWMGSSAPGLHRADEAGLLNGGVPAAAYLLLLLTVLVFVPFAVRHAFGRDPRERTWKVLGIGVVMAALWGVLALLVNVSASMSGGLQLSMLISASGGTRIDMSSGLREPGSMLVAFAWGVLIALGARYLTRPLAGAFPRLAARVTRLPGQAVHPQWAALLADALGRGGHPTPAFLLPSLTEPLTNPPLSVNRRRARAITTALGAVVLLGAGGVVAHQVIAAKVYGPRNAAEDYLDAVSEGHAADALAHLSDRPSAGPLLNDAALGAQLKAAPLRDVKVEDVDGDDEHATVSVSYRVGGHERTADLNMVVDDEHKHFGLWPRWKVSDGLAHIEVTAPSALDSVRVNGKRVPATDGTTGELTVFPGAVSTGASDGSALLEVGGDSLLTVEPGATGASAQLTLGLTGAGEQAVRKAVRDALTSCLSAATDLEPEGCPVYGYSFDTVSDVRWSLDTEPEVNVQVDEASGDITVDGSFDAEVTYTATDSFDDSDAGTEERETDTYTFTGSTDFSTGKPTVEFDD